MQEAGVSAEVFDQVEPEPSLHTVEAGRGACRDAKCDVVVAIGGGSALDVGKAIAGLALSERTVHEHHAGAEIPPRGLPIIAAPTTAGTGSEVTPNSVLSDPDRGVKKSIRGDSLRPRTAIVDPDLLRGMPRALMASSGLDALTQAIESFTSRNTTALTDALALQAFKCLAVGLPAALDNGEDPEALSNMANGSLMAGMALANARLGLVHGLAHPLGFRYHLPHGLVCGALLPYAIRFNQDVAGVKYDQLSAIVGQPLIEFVDRLLEKAGVAGALKRCGIKAEDIPAIADESLPSGSLKANPKPMSKGDIVVMLEEATQ